MNVGLWHNASFAATQLMARSRMTRSGHQSNGLAHLSEERPSSHVFQNMHGAACAVDEVEPTMLVGADVI
jgi:hypothetical protein